MGRPIKGRFFVSGGDTPSNVVKYQGVSSILMATTGTGYSAGTTISIGLPNAAGGLATRAIANITVTPVGGITTATITNSGAGYTTAPAITVNTASARSITANASSLTFTLTNVSSVAGIFVGMLVSSTTSTSASTHVTAVGSTTITLDKVATSTSTSIPFTFTDTGTGATFTVGISQNQLIPNTIATTAYLTTGSSGVVSTIVEQKGSRTYSIVNTQGRGVCKLVTTSTLTAGTMNIIATDGGGATYFVKKLTSRKASLVRRSGTPLVTLTNNAGVAKWTMGASTGTQQVSIQKN